MKISLNWLKNYLDLNIPAEEIAVLLTNCGLEVEAIEQFQSVKGGLEGVVTGEVITCAKHPNADKLSVTTVDIGSGTPLHIVCGAPNVAAGQKVVVAVPGATLFPSEGDPVEIKKSKIRGEVSEGMICAEDELGLGSSHAGIIVLPPDVKTGTPAAHYFKVENDTIFEIGLTPNRADAASHIGVARDLNAVLTVQQKNPARNNGVKIPGTGKFAVGSESLIIGIHVEDPSACPRYTGVTIRGVTVQDSPQWLRNRLLSIGVKPINNVVDVTNFVLHECGQPLHAFDADEIAGSRIVVRNAKAGEKFVTLDGVERQLSESDLMICNEKEPMCIAGIFGGIHSGIRDKTKSIFIESACFSPASIRKTSRYHGLKTDASFRFERGTDPGLTMYALQRAALLICEIAGGEVSSSVSDFYPEKILPRKINFDIQKCTALIGKEIPKPEIREILTALNIEIGSENKSVLELSIPTYKVDVSREADVTEEILRIYGYNNVEIPGKLSASLSSFKNFQDEIQEKVSDYLSAHGFFEMMNNTLTRQPLTNERGIKILNPLSQDLNVLRQNMLFSGLEAIQYNRNRQQLNLRLFELGTTYELAGTGFKENKHLSLFVTGSKEQESWNQKTSEAGFFFLKSFAENILQLGGIGPLTSTTLTGDDEFSYALTYQLNQKVLVRCGAVSKKHLKEFDIDREVFFADFNWDAFVTQASRTKIRHQELPKFPQVRRDLSMLLDTGITYGQLREIAFRTEKNLLKDISLFDVYEGEKIQQGKKSYAVSFVLQDERQTLTDKAIDKIISRLMQAFEKEAGAVIRK